MATSVFLRRHHQFPTSSVPDKSPACQQTLRARALVDRHDATTLAGPPRTGTSVKPQRLWLAASFFAHTPPRHWPGLAYYLVGWVLYRVCGLHFFNERKLYFKEFSVEADVKGRSGLAFLHEILVKDVYNFPALARAGDIRVLFDAGANCGFYTLTQASSRPNLRACSFEPHPNTFHHLKRNIELNDWEDRVIPVHAAVAATSGKCTLQMSAESSMGVVANAAVNPLPLVRPEHVEVAMVSFDDYAKKHGLYPDLIKIDVEGLEVEVLRGARECLARACYVIVEVHSNSLSRESLELLHQARFKTTTRDSVVFAWK
jgi:FkbM family methyltransferase